MSAGCDCGENCTKSPRQMCPIERLVNRCRRAYESKGINRVIEICCGSDLVYYTKCEPCDCVTPHVSSECFDYCCLACGSSPKRAKEQVLILSNTQRVYLADSIEWLIANLNTAALTDEECDKAKEIEDFVVNELGD